jgi:CheY-like chemotaxis protein
MPRMKWGRARNEAPSKHANRCQTEDISATSAKVSSAFVSKASGDKAAGWHIALKLPFGGNGLSMIAVIDDDDSVRAATRSLLMSAGYPVATFSSVEGFIESGAVLETACLVLDLRMPEIDGLEFQSRLNAAAWNIPIIFISAHADDRSRRKAVEAGAVEFFYKPFEAKAFLATVEAVLKVAQASAKPLVEHA